MKKGGTGVRYNEAKNEIELFCREFVRTARRGISTALPFDQDEPTYSPDDVENEKFEVEFLLSGYPVRLFCPARYNEHGEIEIRVPTDSSPKRPDKATISQARAEGFITAYAHILKSREKSATVRYFYYNTQTGEENEVYESVPAKRLESFFQKCLISNEIYAKPEVDRVTVRLPSMRAASFPYDSVRDGQNELMQTVYHTVSHGGTLYTSAPTGTGKTVSTLYPAIKALGRGKCDKIFYFTPKTTTATVVKDCIEKMCAKGAKIRAIVIPSKERVCQCSLVCHTSRELCPQAKMNKLADAVIDIFNTGTAIVDLDELQRAANTYSVCPHEIALSYAELADVVVCDLNYLFDPAVYIRRFFTDGGRYAFLVDEVHNLPDRAREIYSAEITLEKILSPAHSLLIGDHSPLKNATRGAEEALRELLLPYTAENLYKGEDGKDISFAHLSEPPSEIYGICDKLIAITEDEIYNSYSALDEDKNKRTGFLRDYYYYLKKFRQSLEIFDSGFEFFIFLYGDEIRAKCFCIDPANEISKRIKKGTSAVFFSGTLSPLYYYKATLGNDRAARTLEIDSPFSEEQLHVSIIDSVSTRLEEREDTLNAVCRVIAATVSAKRGNYMIFSPSFAYSERLARVFSAKYPKIKVLSQTKNMSAKEKSDFLKEFEKESDSYLIGFCVMGGIYSEGIDLAGESLIGAVIVGIGIPSLSYEREAMAAYYNDKYEEGKQFAYIYPGINRVLQAAGRVIRREEDRGVIVLIDDRFDDPIYKSVIPKHWSGIRYIADPKLLREELDEFWKTHNDIK